jgi:hypothetical protein
MYISGYSNTNNGTISNCSLSLNLSITSTGSGECFASGFVGTADEATEWADELWECDLRYDYMYDAEFEGWALMYEVDSLLMTVHLK